MALIRSALSALDHGHFWIRRFQVICETWSRSGEKGRQCPPLTPMQLFTPPQMVSSTPIARATNPMLHKFKVSNRYNWTEHLFSISSRLKVQFEIIPESRRDCDNLAKMINQRKKHQTYCKDSNLIWNDWDSSSISSHFHLLIRYAKGSVDAVCTVQSPSTCHWKYVKHHSRFYV